MSYMRVPFAASMLALVFIAAPTAHAQQVSPDFAGQVQTTLPSNEQLLAEIQDALPMNDLAVISDQTDASVTSGDSLVQQLTLAQSMAPDDASRSRIEGVLMHAQAALDSLHMAQSETTLDASRGRLDQARGETQEALDELRPFVLGLVATGVITGK
jgi:hypothetical protein